MCAADLSMGRLYETRVRREVTFYIKRLRTLLAMIKCSDLEFHSTNTSQELAMRVIETFQHLLTKSIFSPYDVLKGLLPIFCQSYARIWRSPMTFEGLLIIYVFYFEPRIGLCSKFIFFVICDGIFGLNCFCIHTCIINIMISNQYKND